MTNIIKSKWVLGIVALLVVGVGGYLIFSRHGSAYQFVTVQRGSITESVSLTGNTVAEQSVSLAFGASGLISEANAALGQQVYAGQLLAELNTNDLVASLHQAQASLAQQQATLAGLQGSDQPTDASSNFIIAMRNAYLQSETAILRYADTLFDNPTSANPTIISAIQTQGPAEAIDESRLVLGGKLTKWKTALDALTPSSDLETINNAASIGQDTISFEASYLDQLGTIIQGLNATNGLSQSDIGTYQTAVNTAAQTAGTGASAEQNAYTAWTSAPQDINAQEAAVQAAQANVESAQAQIANAQIVAPISGVVTQFDAKVGQLASPSTPLVSIISNSGYEVDAGVAETDVGKVSVGNAVTMTLDAFPNETFTGTVFYIAPAETNTQGVISYLVKISFSKPDPRLKSGLTANIEIQTTQKDNVLILPQYAILQNDSGTFVETVAGKTSTTTPVTLGIQDQNGNVEVLSGVTEGEQVINIGLKTP
jgi:HlyD family secretion protein